MTICENKAFAILHKTQEGKPALIKQDGGEMLVALVDRIGYRPVDYRRVIESPCVFSSRRQCISMQWYMTHHFAELFVISQSYA